MRKGMILNLLVLSCGCFAAAEPKASPLLARALQAGDVYTFRIELEKLLHEPAKDFFMVMETLFLRQTKKDFNPQTHHKQIIDAAGEALKIELQALLYALIPNLGKKDERGRRPLQSAMAAENPEIYRLLTRYRHFNYDLFEWKGQSVWDRRPKIHKEDIIWTRLPSLALEETALAQALIVGDSEGFHQALRELYEGPAWKVFVILHSRINKTGETLFHLAAKFDPKVFESFTIPGAERGGAGETNEALRNQQREIAWNLKELIEFIMPERLLDSFDKTRLEKQRNLIDFTFGGSLVSMAAPLMIGGLAAGEDPLFVGIAGVITGFGMMQCWRAFQSRRAMARQRRR